MVESLIELVQNITREVESIGARGIRTISPEQLRWLKSTKNQLAEMGAQFLADSIEGLIDAIESDQKPAAKLYQLLTTTKVFERILTLKESREKLEYMIASEESN